MAKRDITSYILTRLFRAASEDEIIFSVCQETGLAWEGAQKLVEQVRIEHQAEIEARQAPLKSVISAVFYILGMFLIVGPIIYLWAMLDITRTFLAFVSNPSGVNADTAFRILGSRCALLGWFQLPSIAFTILVGIGIIHANFRYMHGMWARLFHQWNGID